MNTIFNTLPNLLDHKLRPVSAIFAGFVYNRDF
jgi:hypothetical protein